MINQTSLADPEVPRTGTIRETLNWEGTSPGTTTHTFYLFSIYGVGTTIADVLDNVIILNYITELLQGPGQSIQSNIDTFIPENAPLGTFSCVTFIAEGFNIVTGDIIGVYDEKIDLNVLTITPGITATIISTSFSSV